MARIRTIKPEFPHSESMGRVSREARLCFLLMWTIADDEGRLRGNSRMLASLLYPYDDDAGALIDGWLTELGSERCIDLYEVDGSRFVQIRNWLKHQKIDRPSKSKIPEFDESSRILATGSRGLVVGSGSGPGREGKGSEDRERTSRAQESGGLANPREGSSKVPHETPAAPPPEFSQLTAEFIEATYPPTPHGRNAISALHQCIAIVNGKRATEADLIRRLTGFRDFVGSGGYSSPSAVPSMGSWFRSGFRPDGQQPYWDREWAAVPTKAEQRLQANIDATQEWLRQQEEKDRATG